MSESVEAAAPQGGEVAPQGGEVAPEVEVGTAEVSSDVSVQPDAGSETAVQEQSAGVSSETTKPSFLQFLEDTVGDDGTDLDPFVAGLKSKHIENLTPEGRQIIKNMLRAFGAESARVNNTVTAREAKLRSEAAEIDNRARGLHAQRAALLKMLNNPDITKNANVPEMSPDELMTPEGQKKYLEHLSAKHWKESLEPLAATTQAEAKALAYQKWASDKPEMRNEAFKADMRGLIENRKSMNLSLSTADAYEIVRARQAVSKAETARAREHAVRAASARQIGRGAGIAEKPKGPPKKASAIEIAQFIKANPDYKHRRNRR
mgnify:FL=1|tara:strand:+ start:8837 stop:9793 length:957 start_codon:yes stop_codon:yes gene_type:complete